MPQKIQDALNYDIKPGSCIVIQVLYSLWLGTFTSKIKGLPNHKLYRKDQVFLYPTVEDVARVKIMDKTAAENMSQILSYYDTVRLTYFSGKSFSNSSHMCEGNRTKRVFPTCKGPFCHRQKEHISVNCDWNDIEVTFPKAVQPIYFAIEVTEKPTNYSGIRVFSTFDLRSFSLTHAWSKGSKSWLSSAIYHVNCSQSTAKVANWSKLSHNVIGLLCKMTDGQTHSTALSQGQVDMSVPDFFHTSDSHSHMWILHVTTHHSDPAVLKKLTADVSMIGILHFVSLPLKKLCGSIIENYEQEMAKTELLAHQLGVRFARGFGCAAYHTVINLLTKWTELRIGCQNFQSSRIFFHPVQFVRKRFISAAEPLSLSYTWQSHKYDQEKRRYFQASIRLLPEMALLNLWRNHFRMSISPHPHKLLYFSWDHALRECIKNNMTFPSVENRKSTFELMTFVLGHFHFPTFGLFVGLTQMVSAAFHLQTQLVLCVGFSCF